MENCVLQCETTGVTVRTSAEFLMKTSDLYGAKVGPPALSGRRSGRSSEHAGNRGAGRRLGPPHSRSSEGFRNFGLSRPDSACEVLIGHFQSRFQREVVNLTLCRHNFVRG